MQTRTFTLMLSCIVVFLTSLNAQQDYSMAFDGTNDYITGPNTGMPLGNSPRTVEAFFSMPPGTGAPSMFIQWGSPVASGASSGLGIAPNGVLVWWGHNQDVAGTTSLADGQCHHVAGTYDGTTATIYVDGVPAGSANYNYNTIGSAFYIGAHPQAGWFEDFFLDEVSVWNYAKTAAEIQTAGSTTLTGSEPGLVALYNFGNGPGSSVVTDLAGGNNNGTLVNMDPNTDWVTTPDCPPSLAPPVPTLGQWGLIILCLLILNLGAIGIYSKKYRALKA